MICQNLDRLHDLENRFGPGEFDADLSHLTQQVRKTIDALTAMPTDIHPLIFGKLGTFSMLTNRSVCLENLMSWNVWLAILTQVLQVAPGGEQVSPRQLLFVADKALELLQRYSQAPLTSKPDAY